MLRILKYILPSVILLASCRKGYLDINTDPNNPETVQAKLLLPTAQRALGEALSAGSADNGGLSEMLEVYVHRISTREEADAYGIQGSDFFISSSWPKLYGTLNSNPPYPQVGVLKNLEIIIKNSTADNNLIYAGIAKILKAYTYSQLVDVFGDVPFSEADSATILYPKFDDDASIYPALFTLLDEGVADLNNSSAANLLKPTVDDVIFGGNITNWEKAANTLKLKLYTQLRKKQDVSAEVTTLLAESELIGATSESFVVPFGINGATDDRNPAFDDYTAVQRSNYISPWFYEILKGYNTNILNGNPDPRIPYYFYNQLDATSPSREGSQTEYRDGPFVSVYFGSVGPDRDRIQQNSMTIMGIYPAGGRYDDGGAEEASSTSGTGAAPYRLITYADRLYMEAELMHEGVIAGDARAKLQAAIKESFNQVDYVIANYVKPSQTVPQLLVDDSNAVKTYIAKVLTEYDGNPSKQLQIIMTQKWISSFGSAVDAYTDYRRTGFPILFDPNNPAMAPGGKVQPPINGDPLNPGAQKPVQVLLSVSYPLSLPWYQTELEINQNAPPQKNVASYKIFWMP